MPAIPASHAVAAGEDAVAPALRLVGITRRFGPVLANDGITLALARSEVLALLGENGAGKSTLVNILFGHDVADAGHVEAFGRRLPPGRPRAALDAGIGLVHQRFALAERLSVLDNVMLGTQPAWRPWQRRADARARLLEVSHRFGLAVDPDARVAALSVGERQRVEIVKALARGARVLILDEPTAVLTPQEAESLFATLRRMVAQGLSIVFISHKLDEVLRVSDRVAVLRAGRLVDERPAVGTTRAQLAEAMVGRPVEPPARGARTPGAEVLRLDGVRLRDAQGRWRLDGVDLSVRAGEIVAIAGVSGNGQAALADLLHGLAAADAGTLTLRGAPIGARARPRDWIAAGVARVPEDRHAVGAVDDLSVADNAVLERLRTPAFSWRGWLRRGAARAFARELAARVDLRGGGLDVPARALSGGNLQKLVMGRALSVAGDAGPTLVVAAQPTWGLDVGAVAWVHGQLLQAAARGGAVLVISEDLDEIRAIADRVAVMHAGQLTPLRAVGDWTLAELGLAMAGLPWHGAQETEAGRDSERAC